MTQGTPTDGLLQGPTGPRGESRFFGPGVQGALKRAALQKLDKDRRADFFHSLQQLGGTAAAAKHAGTALVGKGKGRPSSGGGGGLTHRPHSALLREGGASPDRAVRSGSPRLVRATTEGTMELLGLEDEDGLVPHPDGRPASALPQSRGSTPPANRYFSFDAARGSSLPQRQQQQQQPPTPPKLPRQISGGPRVRTPSQSTWGQGRPDTRGSSTGPSKILAAAHRAGPPGRINNMNNSAHLDIHTPISIVIRRPEASLRPQSGRISMRPSSSAMLKKAQALQQVEDDAASQGFMGMMLADLEGMSPELGRPSSPLINGNTTLGHAMSQGFRPGTAFDSESQPAPAVRGVLAQESSWLETARSFSPCSARAAPGLEAADGTRQNSSSGTWRQRKRPRPHQPRRRRHAAHQQHGRPGGRARAAALDRREPPYEWPSPGLDPRQRPVRLDHGGRIGGGALGGRQRPRSVRLELQQHLRIPNECLNVHFRSLLPRTTGPSLVPRPTAYECGWRTAAPREGRWTSNARRSSQSRTSPTAKWGRGSDWGRRPLPRAASRSCLPSKSGDSQSDMALVPHDALFMPQQRGNFSTWTGRLTAA